MLLVIGAGTVLPFVVAGIIIIKHIIIISITIIIKPNYVYGSRYSLTL